MMQPSATSPGSSESTLGGSNDGIVSEKPTDVEAVAPSSSGPNPATKSQQQTDYGKTIHGSSQIACLPHMQGHRLWLLIAVLCTGLLLSTLETTIIATALISISSDLQDYSRSNWIVASYLLTYTGKPASDSC